MGGEYYNDVENIYRPSDIEVPWTYNNPGLVPNFINGTVCEQFHWRRTMSEIPCRVLWTYTGRLHPPVHFIKADTSLKHRRLSSAL
jgi:hypothetical protein